MKKTVVSLLTHYKSRKLLFLSGLHAQSLCKEVQPFDTAVLPHFCANYSTWVWISLPLKHYWLG